MKNRDKIEENEEITNKPKNEIDLNENSAELMSFGNSTESQNLEQTDKKQRIISDESLAVEFEEFLGSMGESEDEYSSDKEDMVLTGSEPQNSNEDDIDFMEDDSQENNTNAKKKGKKKRKVLFNIAIVNFGSKKCKKNSKKITKNKVFAVSKSDEIASDKGLINDEIPQNDLDKNAATKTTPNCDFIGQVEAKNTVVNRTAGEQVLRENVTPATRKNTRLFVGKKSEKNSVINSEKIDNKCEKVAENDDKQSNLNMKRNAGKSGAKRVFFVVGDVSKNVNIVDKEKQDLRAENEALKKENLALKREKNQRREKGFVYAEILSNKSKKDRVRDELLAELQEERARNTEKQKQQDREREIREEKTHDIIRQRKDIQYGMEYIRRKADKWREVSAEAYSNAILSFYADMGRKNTNMFGFDRYSIYMRLSVAAMKYCMEYQHDLDLEQEKLLQKERELEQLMQR